MKIALKQNNKYLCAEGGGNDAGVVNINRDAIGPWETLTVWQLGDGFVALETMNRRFISRMPQGELLCNRCRRSDSQTNRMDLRTVADDVISLPHDAWESFAWSDLQARFTIVTLDSGLQLRIEGRHFYDGSGQVVLVGTDQMRSYERFRNGEDLTPLLRESLEIGFNVWRVFLMAEWTVHPQDDDLSQLGPFVDFLNERGFIPQVEVFADCQTLLPNVNDRIVRWNRVNEILRGKVVLVSCGNEWDKNGFNPGEFADPQNGILWSRGSATGDKACFLPEGRFNLFHPRRDMPKMMDDSVASSTYLYNSYGLRGPLIMDEGIGFASYSQDGRRSNDPQLARRLAGHYAFEWDGAYFHNESGMSSITMDDRTRQCAQEWANIIYKVTGQRKP